MASKTQIALVTSILCAVLFMPVAGFGDDADQNLSTGTACYPLAWSGIVPGITVDKDVVALYGEGIIDKDAPHGGFRYYTDKDKSVTVIVAIGVDNIIEGVTVKSGLEMPPYLSAQHPFVSLRIDPNEGFGNCPKLHLGSTKDDVRTNLGEPKSSPGEESNNNKWVYETDYRNTNCYPYSALTLTFVNNCVDSIDLYIGE